MLRRRKLRRTLGALLVVAGGLLLWLAPETAFVSSSISGWALMLAGAVVEIAGIALERYARNEKRDA